MGDAVFNLKRDWDEGFLLTCWGERNFAVALFSLGR